MIDELERAAEGARCVQCGAPLEADQEWCLECGTGRTLIAHPPDWRIPVLVVGTVVALAVAVLVIVLVNLSNDSQPTAAAVGTATAPAPAGPQISGWAVSLPGWTVQLAIAPTRSEANTEAQSLAAAGLAVGVLNSSQHPSMPPGHWIVFSGRYPTRAAARAQARQLRQQGYPGARVRLVGKPGQ